MRFPVSYWHAIKTPMEATQLLLLLPNWSLMKDRIYLMFYQKTSYSQQTKVIN